MTPEGALTPCRHMVSGSISLRSQRFFSPFPRGTCSLSVADLYLALCGGPHIFTLRFTCAVLLWNSLGPTQISVTGVSPSMPLLSRSFSYLCWSHVGVRTPEKYLWFGLYRFRSPLLAVSISLSFPPLTEMFHFSGYRELFPTFPIKGASEKDDAVLPTPGYPIRKSPDQSVFATPRSLSQLITSFIAIQHQGIHCVPFKA